MDTLGPAAEWLRLSERYRQMSDDELIALARQTSELTDAAQQVLAQEIFQRKLKVQPEEPQRAPDPEPPPGSLYTEERELVEICTVWSLSDALQLQTLLDRAGIPFFMGPEKATGVDAVTSNFAEGVGVQVMRVGQPLAHQAMQHYRLADGPFAGKEENAEDFAIRCPKCHSTEVVFERLVSEPATATEGSPTKYQWTCDSCGHEWEDEGVETEE